jgi:selenium-binding protein 1
VAFLPCWSKLELILSQISVVNTPGDYKGHWIDILDNGALSFNRTIDFEDIFTKNRGGARPHSSVIFDLTDPANPKYY